MVYARLVVEKGNPKEMCYIEVTLMCSNWRFHNEHNLDGLFDHSKTNRNSSVTSHSFGNSNPILELGKTLS